MATQAFSYSQQLATPREEIRRVGRVLAEGDYAVVANANARGFSKAVKGGLFDAVPQADFFASKSLEESASIMQNIVDRGYRTVFAAGGDGTVAQLLNDLRAAAPNPADQPKIGIIRMGTGNALASYVGSRAAAADLATLSGGATCENVHVQLIESEGSLAPFAGMGVDAGVLNDYIRLKKRVRGTVFERAVTGVRGYLASGILKTTPTMFARGAKQRLFVINDAPVAYAVNQNGEILHSYRRGDVLYSGDAIMAAVGSIPYYGYNMKMFPVANRLPGFFQVRIANMNPLLAVPRLGKIWRGTIGRDEGVYDFLSPRVRFEFDSPVPFHLSGDAHGERREVTFALSKRRFEFVRLHDAA